MSLFEAPEPRYRDREEAGLVLASRLEPFIKKKPILLAIPNGGAAVGVAMARELDAPLCLMIVRKLQIPDNPEAGFGALCSDGTLHLNHRLVDHLGLTLDVIEQQKEKAQRSIRERQIFFGEWTRLPCLEDSMAVLVDDGLASGFTMEAAVHSTKQQGADSVYIAVPTSSRSAYRMLEPSVERIICPDISRAGLFAVANAYAQWRDLEDEEVLRLLQSLA